MANKVIIVTGASAGIGRVCANRLQASGWTVIGASRREVPDASWQSLVMDVDDDLSVSRGVAEVISREGRLDAVLANAGWGLAGAAEKTPIADAKAQMETNFWGVVRVVQAALPHFRAHGGGRVVITSSIGGVIGIPFQSFYSASKFALEGWGEALAYEVAPYGVHVSLIEPGNFKTDFTANRRLAPASEDDAYTAAQQKAVSVMERDERRGADPRAVAALVERILVTHRPPRRASVGKLDERVGIIAKRVIPYRVFEAAAKGALGV